jgi:hypothetical protein
MIFIDSQQPLPQQQQQQQQQQQPEPQYATQVDASYPLLTQWKCTLYIAALFLLLSHPRVYILTSRFHSRILNSNNNASFLGMIVHACIFLIIVRILINFTEQ